MTHQDLSRREFLIAAAATLPLSVEENAPIDLTQCRAQYQEAKRLLRGLVVKLSFGTKPVLASTPANSLFGYAMWAETSMLEGLLYASDDPQVALGTHEIFFNSQRADGLMPAVIFDKVPDFLKRTPRIRADPADGPHRPDCLGVITTPERPGLPGARLRILLPL